MTVNEFIDKIEGYKKYKNNIGEYSITVQKNDKHQLTCSTTVPIDDFKVGFDWTMNQIVLEPSVKLTTHPNEKRDAMIEKLAQYSKDLTRHMSLAAKLARMLDEIPDEEVRNRFHSVLKEF